MSKNLLVAALAAFTLAESDVFASAERDGCMVIVTTAGQKLVYDPNNPPVQAETLADTPKEGAEVQASAPTAGAKKAAK